MEQAPICAAPSRDHADPEGRDIAGRMNLMAKKKAVPQGCPPQGRPQAVRRKAVRKAVRRKVVRKAVRRRWCARPSVVGSRARPSARPSAAVWCGRPWSARSFAGKIRRAGAKKALKDLPRTDGGRRDVMPRGSLGSAQSSSRPPRVRWAASFTEAQRCSEGALARTSTLLAARSPAYCSPRACSHRYAGHETADTGARASTRDAKRYCVKAPARS
jgi:hypothetical protein